MTPRIAIPLPTSEDPAYNAQNWVAYADAVREAGGEPVAVALDLMPKQIAELANTCQGILLPGSPADVNPAKYGQARLETTAKADLPRENVDELLLQDAHNLYKPLLCVCFGAQMLNVWRSGTLVQDLLPMPVNHRAARGVAVAHTALVPQGSLLANIVTDAGGVVDRVEVNSSHHQAIGIAGDGLTVSARCPQDGVVEAIEGGQANSTHSESGSHPTHFVLGVQWHPERTFAGDPVSRTIFTRFVQAATTWEPRAVLASVAV